MLRRAARAALRAEGVPPAAEVSVLVTDDEEIRRLNRDYRAVHSTTDVLAFPQDRAAHRPRPERERDRIMRARNRGGRVARACRGQGPGHCEPPLLGDVVISAPTARRQARQRHRSLDDEMQLLLIHGILHLTGWRDDTETERQRMLRRARVIQRLAEVGKLT